MAHILVLNGPNLNLLGQREPGVYGQVTLQQIEDRLARLATESGHQLTTIQSNSESELLECIQGAPAKKVDFIIFNPAGLTHTSVILRDALLAFLDSLPEEARQAGAWRLVDDLFQKLGLKDGTQP